MKKTLPTIIFASIITIALAYNVRAPKQPPTSEISFGQTMRLIEERLSFVQTAFAKEGGDATCSAKSQEAWSSCFKKDSAYLHGALNFFNNTLCILNKGFPSQVETTLCHFNKSMGINPDKAALPVSVTKTFGDKTVVITVEKPTESFATTLGYDAKGTVKVNGSNFMILYWGGTDTSTKGFMISGATNMGDDTVKHPSYIQWSRTDAEAQFVKVFVANYTTSYLGSVSRGSSTSPQGGDRAMYGEATFKSSTKAVTAQTVSIEAQRSSGSTTAGCFKMFTTGAKDGQISIAKTKDALNTTGHATTDTNKDGTDMDAAVLTDSATTANGTGNYSTTSAAGMTVSFTKSCNDILVAGNATKPFASGEVSFTAAPTDIF